MVWVAFDTSKGEAKPEAYWKSLKFPEIRQIRSPCDDLLGVCLVKATLCSRLQVSQVSPHRGTRVTEVEKQTLRWVAENLDLTEKGRAFLQQQLNDGHLTDVLGEFILWILWNGI